MEQPINVTFFHIDSDQPGGGTKMVFRLLNRLNKNKFEIRLVVQQEGYLYKSVQNLDIQTEVVPFLGILDTYNRQLLSTSLIGKIRTTARILQYNVNVRSITADSDVIWCENLRMVLTLLPTVRIRSTPVVWNIGLGIPSEGKIKYLNDIGLQSASHIFIESEKQAQRVFTNEQYKNFEYKFNIFHKGIDLEKFDPDRYDSTKKEGYKIGTAASLTPRKGLEYLIDAMPVILAEHDSVTLLIAGQPPNSDEEYANKLKQRVKRYGLEDHIKFLGWVEDMPAYYNKLDVFILPSLNEGIPGAVREALSMKVPVVATDVGGTSDAILNGKTGFIFQPEDSEAIAEKVNYLLSNPNMRKNMGAKGRKRMINSFSIKSYIKNYEQFFEDIVLNKHL